MVMTFDELFLEASEMGFGFIMISRALHIPISNFNMNHHNLPHFHFYSLIELVMIGLAN